MLPKISHPIFELTLPISNQTVKFRPFLVKEKSILLTTINSDMTFLVDNVVNVIKNCCITPIEIDELCTVDLEYFFIQLRAKSVSEIIEKSYVCKHKVDDVVCGNIMEVQFDLNDITVDKSSYKDVVMLTPEIGLKMKYPNKDSLTAELTQKDDELTNSMILSCIDYVFDENDVYKIKDVAEKEKSEFIESFSLQNYKDIKTFFENLPVLRETKFFHCNKCGFKHDVTLEGISDFLG